MRRADVETYRLNAGMRVFMPFVFVFMLVVGVFGFVSVLASGDSGGAGFFVFWFGILGTQAYLVFFRMPHTIEVDDRELRLIGRTRRVTIPWSQLRSVKSPAYDMNRQTLLWRWEGGRKVRTFGSFENQHRLLTAVEQRAPHAELRV